MIELSGKTILVTGGSRGIGEAIVRAVSGAGADVLLHFGKSRAAAEAIQGEIGRERCRLIAADLAQPNAAADLWRQAIAAAPRIDALINNAGIFEPVAIDATTEAWHS